MRRITPYALCGILAVFAACGQSVDVGGEFSNGLSIGGHVKVDPKDKPERKVEVTPDSTFNGRKYRYEFRDAQGNTIPNVGGEGTIDSGSSINTPIPDNAATMHITIDPPPSSQAQSLTLTRGAQISGPYIHGGSFPGVDTTEEVYTVWELDMEGDLDGILSSCLDVEAFTPKLATDFAYDVARNPELFGGDEDLLMVHWLVAADAQPNLNVLVNCYQYQDPIDWFSFDAGSSINEFWDATLGSPIQGNVAVQNDGLNGFSRATTLLTANALVGELGFDLSFDTYLTIAHDDINVGMSMSGSILP